jgi:integrin alpha-ps, putative
VHVRTNARWGFGICYSYDTNLRFDRTWEPCIGKPVNKAHEQYGYCQAGTSGDISEEHDIIIGVPGPYTWRGTLFTNAIRWRLRDEKAWHYGPVLENQSPVDKYSYLGNVLSLF